jgi:hypothetical protein
VITGGDRPLVTAGRSPSLGGLRPDCLHNRDWGPLAGQVGALGLVLPAAAPGRWRRVGSSAQQRGTGWTRYPRT